MKQQVFFKVLGVIILLALLPGVGASQARREPDTQPGGDFVPGEVLVKFKLGATPTIVNGVATPRSASLAALFQQYGITSAAPLFPGVSSSYGLEQIYKLTLPANADVWAAVAAFSADAGIEYAEPNYTYNIMGVPSGDPLESTNTNTGAYYLPLRAGSNQLALQAGSNQQIEPSMQVLQWPVYVNETWGYSIAYPPTWEIQVVITNRNDRPAYVIRQRVALLGPMGSEVTIDVWQKETDTELMEWIDENQRQFLELGGVELPPTTNAIVGSQDALVVSQPGGCMSPQIFFAYVDAVDRVLLIQYTAHDEGKALDIYRAMLASVSIEVPTEHLESRANMLPGFLFTVSPLDTCELAPNEDGCCGYPQVPHWQCSRDVTSLEHRGNCTYWAAYKRPDVGAAVGSGNAGQWALQAQTAGYYMDNTPRVGDIMVIEDNPGHVAYVTGVSGSTVYVTEMNWCTTCPERSWSYTSNGKIFIHGPVNDPYFTYQWGLHNTRQTGGKEDADIDAPEAWLITTGTTDVMVAVIDTGVDYNHEDLNDGRVRTDIDWDYVNNDDDAMDDHSHGTHVAGIIAAETNNGVGVAGVMWQAQILPLKVCNSQGSCPVDAIASAIRYAADKGADVINMSLGGSDCSQTIADAVNYAYFDKGLVIVAAAGNDGGGSISYPAKLAPVIAVGATDHNDHKASFSNFGDELDVVAPGVTIFSTVPNNGYDAFSGTSMASPHVAGVAGLLLAQRPDLSNGQVREILRQSADDLGESGFDKYYGYGRVNAYQALQTDTPDEPKAPERAECPASVCGASVAVAGEPDEESLLSNLRAVRDQVFTEDPGRRWVRIYYEHQAEVAWLLMSDSQLRADALAGFRAFYPVFRAGLDDDKAGPPVILTPELIEAARRPLMGVAERGSPAVHDVIIREWNKVDPYRFVGWNVLEVWEQLCREEQPNQVYLPLILRH
jgi:subtilisin family serine protease